MDERIINQIAEREVSTLKAENVALKAEIEKYKKVVEAAKSLNYDTDTDRSLTYFSTDRCNDLVLALKELDSEVE